MFAGTKQRSSETIPTLVSPLASTSALAYTGSCTPTAGAPLRAAYPPRGTFSRFTSGVISTLSAPALNCASTGATANPAEQNNAASRIQAGDTRRRKNLSADDADERR